MFTIPQLALFDIESITVTPIADTQHFSDALISPDARYLAVTVMDSAATETRLFDISMDFTRIYTIADTLIVEWNPNGNRLLLKDVSNSTGIYTVFDLQSGIITDLPGSQGLNIAHVAWSPDGRSIAYTANRFPFQQETDDLNYVLYVATTDSDTSQQMTETRLSIRSFFWTAEDRLMYSQCNSDDVCVLYVTNTMGDSTALQGNYQFAQYSPPGSMLLAVRQVEGVRQLGFLDLDTEAFQIIEPDYAYRPQPGVRWLSWSPDGMHVSYLEVDQDGDLHMNIVDTSNTLITEISSSLEDDAGAGYWEHNSERLIFDGGMQQNNMFYVFDMQSGNVQRIELPVSDGYASKPRWICEYNI